jgi:energy-coupling factor transporter ATP-binding protein EcfA2
MLKSIKITGYRGFSEFEMSNLGRVNLLVGKNNSGKTSALEGLYLLASHGNPWSLWTVLWRRGEKLPERGGPNAVPEIDICHLFHGHEALVGSKFTLGAQNETPGRNVSFSIGEVTEERKKTVTPAGVTVPSRLGLFIKGSPDPVLAMVPLSRQIGVTSESLDLPRRARSSESAGEAMPSRFITAESLTGDEVMTLWDSVTLTPDEERVYVALRFLEPDIERIAPQASRQNYYGNQRGGFLVKMKNHIRPLPIGSMGDGMWRIMSIAIAIAQCKDGILLIDEIDTGLHYSVMTDMWKLIYGAAKELNVQVFATTHSYDCVKSLAELCFADAEAAKEVTLQRIEQGKKKSVPYTAKEIETAALHQIEVR